MFTDGQDTYYQYVKGRILTYNSSRVVAGMLSAQDWPYKEVKFDAFYLLVLGEVPIGKQAYSAAVPIKFHQMQWVWINKGTDLVQGIRQANRGDKYRTMQNMKGELTYAHYPGFCEKQTWALNTAGVWTGTPENPVEYIQWQPIEFHEKWSEPGGAGIGYGAGAVRVADMLDVITA
jgi:hypothetical protein